MVKFVFGYSLILIFYFLSLNTFAEGKKKPSRWKNVACSKQALYVKNSDAKEVYVPANVPCATRAQQFRFDPTLCQECAQTQDKGNTSTKPSSSVTTTGPGSGDTDEEGSGGSTTNSGSNTASSGSTDTPSSKKNGNNGHGNDPDGNDSSNPGDSNNGDGTDADGSPGKGKGVSK